MRGDGKLSLFPGQVPSAAELAAGWWPLTRAGCAGLQLPAAGSGETGSHGGADGAEASRGWPKAPPSSSETQKNISAKGQGMHRWLLVQLLMLIKPRSKIQHRSSASYRGTGAARSQKGIHLLKVVRHPLSSGGRAAPVEARPQFRLSLARASLSGDTVAATRHRVSEGYGNAALPTRTRQP